ncbi:hypothetical protein KP509_23G053400 [Ceratopteris richardii]|uniref:Pentatricopeptide repeat-containing protein n=1 Tax=Ceratopteris richardii TaxID=49495 RepID=A0A8T2RZW8_CERRI|nr:hypothetical protein KP509_23G053400 [Ceratopteris richardii]
MWRKGIEHGGAVDGKDGGRILGAWEVDMRGEFPLLFVSRKEARTKLPHSEVVKKCQGKLEHYRGLVKVEDCNSYIGTTLIDMYAKCHMPIMAQEVFDMLPARDIVSWTALIAGFAKHDLGMEALRCFDCLQDDGFHPNAVTYVSLQKGIEIHAKIEKDGMLGTNLAVGNALIDMYVKCGLISKAHEVFNRLPNQDVVSWTALIAGYAKHGDAMFALKCLDEMQLKGVAPNAVTYVCCLIACGRIGDVEKGKEIHEEIVSKGLLETLALGNALVDMYANCGFLKRALEVFDILPKRDVISWNALMSSYVNYEYGIKALNCLAQMQIEEMWRKGIEHGGAVDGKDGGRILGAWEVDMRGEFPLLFVSKKEAWTKLPHSEVVKKCQGKLEHYRGLALIDMYAKCHMPIMAQEVFDMLPARDIVSWTALIAGFAKHDLGMEALRCFDCLQDDGFHPNAVTYVCTLNACGNIKALQKGIEIHAKIEKDGMLGTNLAVGNALIDMYVKCGLISKAHQVFNRLPNQDVVSWTALITPDSIDGWGASNSVW